MARTGRPEGRRTVEGQGDLVAERDGVVAHVLSGAADVGDAITLLDAAEAAVQVPLVDEAERERLRRLAEGSADPAAHWYSVLARRGTDPVGYAGILLPATVGEPARADVAFARDRGPCGPVLSVLLASLEELASRHATAPVRLQAWIRHATADDISRADREGYGIDRRLAVLGRRLDDLDDALDDTVRPSTDLTLRAYRPDVDDDAVVEVLSAAYAGTPEGDWDLAAFQERRRWSWFRPEDLLVAEGDTGRLLGLHWLKRRSATLGEVYNLAIHPDGQGRGLGPVLLAAGLDHLRQVGCSDVILWVDLANEHAVGLYRSLGFTSRWEDVALGRDLPDRS